MQMLQIAKQRRENVEMHGARKETSTELCYKVGPRLRELASRGQWEPGGGIHATSQPISIEVCGARNAM